MNIEKKILEVAEKKNKTISDIATYVGIDRSTFYRKLNGETKSGFSIKEVNAIVSYLGLTKKQASDIFFS